MERILENDGLEDAYDLPVAAQLDGGINIQFQGAQYPFLKLGHVCHEHRPAVHVRQRRPGNELKGSLQGLVCLLGVAHVQRAARILDETIEYVIIKLLVELQNVPERLGDDRYLVDDARLGQQLPEVVDVGLQGGQ